MRMISLDTETTGLSFKDGDRIVEIGAVEMNGLALTGRTFHQYVNPQRAVDQEAFEIHGISNEFLADKPIFSAIASAFVDFIGTDSKLVIHNAAFDMEFLNGQLVEAGHAPVAPDRVIDSLQVARTKHPGSPANLDALCRRYKIDNSNRDLHGGLLDAQLLARVYIEMLGGAQQRLDFLDGSTDDRSEIMGDALELMESGQASLAAARRVRRIPPSPAEVEAHRGYRDTMLGGKSLWSPASNA